MVFTAEASYLPSHIDRKIDTWEQRDGLTSGTMRYNSARSLSAAFLVFRLSSLISLNI